MTRTIFTTGTALLALTSAAILALSGSGHTMSKQQAERSESGASAAISAQTRAALHATKVTHALPPMSARIETRLRLRRPGVVPPAPRVPDEGVENEENSNPTSTKLMTNHGGAVQTSPHVYLVFWGANWFSGGDPYGAAARLHNFFSGVSGSGWANVLKQYTSAYGSFTNPLGQYKGWIQDTTAVPAMPTQTDISNAVLRATARIGDRSYNAQYVIAMPWGVFDQYSRTQRACAWHNYMYVNSSQWVTYTALPYMPYVDSAFGFNCGTGRVNGSAGILDGVTINAAHEYAETVNDPSLHTYYDVDGSENADKCSWKNLANRTFANGMSFAVQPSWSNSYRNTYGNGCLYSG